MKIIKPVTLTDSEFVSSNVSETPPDAYASGTTYVTGDQVTVAATHKIYESLQDANIGNYPPNNLDGETPYWWEVGATMPWKAFDTHIGTSKVSNLNSITYTLTPGQVTGVALLEVEGLSVNITMADPTEGEVYNKDISILSTENVYDWYTYFFEGFNFDTAVIQVDLPPYRNCTLTITITAETGKLAKVGEIVIGSVLDLGFTQYAPQISIIDYSKKTTDTFGNFIVLERAYSKRVDINVVVENGAINTITKILSDLRATPVVWIATENETYASSLVVYGYYRDFSMVIPHPIWAEMNLQVEGLT